MRGHFVAHVHRTAGQRPEFAEDGGLLREGQVDRHETPVRDQLAPVYLLLVRLLRGGDVRIVNRLVVVRKAQRRLDPPERVERVDAEHAAAADRLGANRVVPREERRHNRVEGGAINTVIGRSPTGTTMPAPAALPPNSAPTAAAVSKNRHCSA